ncbi:hypothetical protein HPB52_016519 [Rhipicephalus sanguineus]|uniref:THAP-type domain-containing protein n=1 Tax=Rhipicephalus sanguineus TaxID=34632 RepID=A0A9D4QFC9_RHISA|nr:hypothetical protein HPB52_016519 [Rhipicephalus sanguineus]
MPYCCVPHCKSWSGRKETGISFHEIPSDQELREKWLKVISRDNWTPNSTSCYSTVCSRHFVPSDFKEGCTTRRLKKGSVPSVFHEYPSYLQPCKQTERSDAALRKRAAAVLTGEPARKRRAVGGGAPHVFTDLRDDQSCTSDALLAEEVPNSSSRTDQGFVPRTALVDRAVQVASRISLPTIERRKWRRKERELRAQIERLKGTVDKYKRELQKLKEDCYVPAFLQVVEQASENELAASILLEQVKNFQKVKPTWSEVTVRHAVVLRNLSAKAYEHIRSSGLLRLPCRSTLERFLSSSRKEVGITDLIKQRLSAELASHTSAQSKTCSLIVDEMRVKQRLLYLKQRDAFVGEVDYGDCLPQKQPGKPEEPDGEITAQYLKDLYKMQQRSIVKPVRFLTRKHVYPTSMEKMNARRAVQVVSPPVTAALKLLKEQAGHTCDASFAHVGPTVVFMDTMYRWFTLMDVSNCTQHVHQNNPDCKQYESEDDERLGWLEASFLDYLAEIKRQSPAKNFLTKETYEGLLITTISNVEKSAGSNDQTDVRAVLSGIEKALKTGIACTSSSSNVMTAESSSCSSSALLHRSARAAQNDGEAFPAGATTTLRRVSTGGRRCSQRQMLLH